MTTQHGGEHPRAERPAPAGGFDALRPPSPELLSDCVHCGFCLSACPTYALTGEETKSPRGRIYQMQLIDAGEAPLSQAAVGHFDTCLGCMACVPACPSGVQYDRLIESVRPQIERNWKRSRAERAFRGLVFGLFPHPRRLRVAAVFGALYQRLGLRRLLRRTGALRRLPARVRALEALMPDVRLRSALRRTPERSPARTATAGAEEGVPRRTVGLVTGCVQQVFFAHVNEATVRVLTAEGCEVLAPAAQGCCGALSEHTGREEEARRRARRLIDAFADADVDAVVVNVAGCGSALKEYGRLLADDPQYRARAEEFAAKVCDVSELLAALPPSAPRHPVRARVAHHEACHLSHAQGVRDEPRRVLGAVPELTLVDLPEAGMCCGSAGVYNLLQPETAAALGRRKAANVRATAPDAVVTANPGCLLQISRHLDEYDAAPHAAGSGGRHDDRHDERPDTEQHTRRHAEQHAEQLTAGEGPLPVLHPVQIVDASIRGVRPW